MKKQDDLETWWQGIFGAFLRNTQNCLKISFNFIKPYPIWKHHLEMHKQLWCLICRRAENPPTLPQNHWKVELFSTYCLHTGKTSITQSSTPGECSSQKAAFFYILCSPKEDILCTTNLSKSDWRPQQLRKESQPASVQALNRKSSSQSQPSDTSCHHYICFVF